ncbi:hypothetical protein BDZ45DRAFT_757317, partial [Acephala macrosclerotiorum]
RYGEKLFRAYLRSGPTFIWCSASRCDSGQFHEGECPEMSCVSCKTKTCTYHQHPWHEGETCEEYDTRRQTQTRQDKLSMGMIFKKCKLCPKCHIKILKEEGCDHFKHEGYSK